MALLSCFAEPPPLPDIDPRNAPVPPPKRQGYTQSRKSMATAENDRIAAQQAATALATNVPKSNIQPAQQRVIDSVAAQKLKEWRAADERMKWTYTPKGRTWNHPAFSRGLSSRSPKDAAAKESPLRDKRMTKPVGERAKNERKK